MTNKYDEFTSIINKNHYDPGASLNGVGIFEYNGEKIEINLSSLSPIIKTAIGSFLYLDKIAVPTRIEIKPRFYEKRACKKYNTNKNKTRQTFLCVESVKVLKRKRTINQRPKPTTTQPVSIPPQIIFNEHLLSDAIDK